MRNGTIQLFSSSVRSFYSNPPIAPQWRSSTSLRARAPPFAYACLEECGAPIHHWKSERGPSGFMHLPGTFAMKDPDGSPSSATATGVPSHLSYLTSCCRARGNAGK
nr:hypothetical protein CFP56_11101 [Quercus suber]